MDGEHMICQKYGIVPAAHRCRKFRYDPLKRVPSRPHSGGRLRNRTGCPFMKYLCALRLFGFTVRNLTAEQSQNRSKADRTEFRAVCMNMFRRVTKR